MPRNHRQSFRYFEQLLAQHFGKKSGILVGSGTLALEVALRACNVGFGDEVIVPDNCCFLIPLSVIRVGAIPVFVYTQEHLLLKSSFLKNQLTEKTKAIIAVHNYGLPCNIAAIRGTVGNSAAIIEDAAQTWKIKYRGFKVGTHSDIVVTSLGFSKPLGIGGGGAAFSDKVDLHSLIDCHSNIARTRNFEPLPYTLNHFALSKIENAIKKADCIIRTRRSFVSNITSDIHLIGYKMWTPKFGDKPSWHRLPIFLPKYRFPKNEHFYNIFNKYNIQLSHREPIYELPIFKGRCRFQKNSGRKKRDFELVLIRTDNTNHQIALTLKHLKILKKLCLKKNI